MTVICPPRIVLDFFLVRVKILTGGFSCPGGTHPLESYFLEAQDSRVYICSSETNIYVQDDTSET